MSKHRNYHKPSLLRAHADTVAIIGVNLALGAMLLSMIISNSHRIDVSNARSDLLHQTLHQEIKEFHGRLCSIEERNKK